MVNFNLFNLILNNRCEWHFTEKTNDNKQTVFFLSEENPHRHWSMLGEALNYINTSIISLLRT